MNPGCIGRLNLLLGRNWVKAMQVVDQGAVQCFQAETSGRTIFQVIHIQPMCCLHAKQSSMMLTQHLAMDMFF